MKKIILTITSILTLTILLTGCATLFASNTHSLAVSSEPYGADVYVILLNIRKKAMNLLQE